MKKRGFLSLLLIWLLMGCAASGGAPDERPAETPPVQIAEAAPQAEATREDRETALAPVLAESEDLTAAQTQAQPRPLTEDEVLGAYNRAVTVYSWFELSPLPAEGDICMVDGTAYRRVNFRGLETMDDLRAYLRGFFSEEVTERLLATGGSQPLYRDVDDRLCVTGGGRERNADKGAVNAQVERVEETVYFVNVTVEMMGEDRSAATGIECYAFPYELVGDRWVFTDFALVY